MPEKRRPFSVNDNNRWLNQNFNIRISIFLECLTYERKSNIPTISSRNWKVSFETVSKNGTTFQNRWSTINSVFLFLEGSGGVESTAVSTLHRSIEKKNRQKFVIHRSIHIFYFHILALSSFSFPEEMPGLIDFLLVHTYRLFLGILGTYLPNIKKFWY